MEVGLVHFQSTFQDSNGPQYSSIPAWVLEAMPRPENMTEFNISPVTPTLIKRFLRKLPNASAPGPDRISYLHLKKLPSTHHLLATLFSKIILTNHCPPTIWCKGILRLIHKIHRKFLPNRPHFVCGQTTPQDPGLTIRRVHDGKQHNQP